MTTHTLMHALALSNYVDTVNACASNRQLRNACLSDEFWNNKALMLYGLNLSTIPNELVASVQGPSASAKKYRYAEEEIESYPHRVPRLRPHTPISIYESILRVKFNISREDARDIVSLLGGDAADIQAAIDTMASWIRDNTPSIHILACIYAGLHSIQGSSTICPSTNARQRVYAPLALIVSKYITSYGPSYYRSDRMMLPRWAIEMLDDITLRIVYVDERTVIGIEVGIIDELASMGEYDRIVFLVEKNILGHGRMEVRYLASKLSARYMAQIEDTIVGMDDSYASLINLPYQAFVSTYQRTHSPSMARNTVEYMDRLLSSSAQLTPMQQRIYDFVRSQVIAERAT